MIGVSRSKIYDLIASGAIPSVRLQDGRMIRVPAAALMHSLKTSQRTEPARLEIVVSIHHLRSVRIHCPVHAGGDADCEVRFDDKETPRWASRNCPRRLILAALRGSPISADQLDRIALKLDSASAYAAAWRSWNFSRSISGTLGERYLKEARGISIGRWPGSLRYNANAFHHRNSYGDFYFPALIACAEVDGRFAGIHRTWLDPGTRRGSVVRLTPYTFAAKWHTTTVGLSN